MIWTHNFHNYFSFFFAWQKWTSILIWKQLTADNSDYFKIRKYISKKILNLNVPIISWFQVFFLLLFDASMLLYFSLLFLIFKRKTHKKRLLNIHLHYCSYVVLTGRQLLHCTVYRLEKSHCQRKNLVSPHLLLLIEVNAAFKRVDVFFFLRKLNY